MPVLDDDKHYWVNEAEVEKLLRHGEAWLNTRPKRELIVKRYLKRQHRLTRQAFAQLLEEDESDLDNAQGVRTAEETVLEERVSLNTQRIEAVVAALKQATAKRVLDLGCGEGKLLQALLNDKDFTAIAGMDVSYRTLEIAHDRLRSTDCRRCNENASRYFKVR
jgi:2-polyprenyl-3-methyl-5-hydroxy-6-metoxy-1,4-benzoquinol methylase